MSGHTPGPWDVRTGRADIGGHGHKIWAVGTDDVGCAIVILPDEDDTPKARAERAATAHFVAAAPALKEALEGMADAWLREEANWGAYNRAIDALAACEPPKTEPPQRANTGADEHNTCGGEG